jgi:hypothetical protein
VQPPGMVVVRFIWRTDNFARCSTGDGGRWECAVLGDPPCCSCAVCDVTQAYETLCAQLF